MALGIMPYISASIVVQLMELRYHTYKNYKRWRKWTKEDYANNKMVTIAITLFQALTILEFQNQMGFRKCILITEQHFFHLYSFSAGNFCNVVRERITDKGLQRISY